MRLAYHTDYAIRVLVFLAVRPGERFPTHVVADALGLSTSHLHKIVRNLGVIGVLDLQRGVKGGVKLLLDPERISIGEVVRELDDRDGLVECFRSGDDACLISPACAAKDALRVAQTAFYDSLSQFTLADMLAGRRAAKLRKLTGSTVQGH